MPASQRAASGCDSQDWLLKALRPVSWYAAVDTRYGDVGRTEDASKPTLVQFDRYYAVVEVALSFFAVATATFGNDASSNLIALVVSTATGYRAGAALFVEYVSVPAWPHVTGVAASFGWEFYVYYLAPHAAWVIMPLLSILAITAGLLVRLDVDI